MCCDVTIPEIDWENKVFYGVDKLFSGTVWEDVSDRSTYPLPTWSCDTTVRTTHSYALYVLYCLTYMYCTLYILYTVHGKYSTCSLFPCFRCLSDVEVSSSTSVQTRSDFTSCSLILILKLSSACTLWRTTISILGYHLVYKMDPLLLWSSNFQHFL